MMVSVFKNIFSKTPYGEIDILTWVTSPIFKTVVEELREADMDSGLLDFRKKKLCLPAITPMGTFTERRYDGIKSYSGLLCIDIDSKDNPTIKDWDVFKCQIRDFPGLFYAGLSVSGNGVYMLIRTLRKEDYRITLIKIFNMLENMKIYADRSCVDVARLRLASYDSNPIINPDVVAIDTRDIEEPQTSTMDLRTFDGNSRYGKSPRIISHYHSMLLLIKIVAKIYASRIDITSGYRQWFEIGCSIASVTNDSTYFHTISQFYPNYNREECEKTFYRCIKYSSNYTIGTLLLYCERYGIYAKYK